MSAYDIFVARNAVGAIVYLDDLIAALDARITALEPPPGLIAQEQPTEGVDNGSSDANSDGVRNSPVNDAHSVDNG